ncbi:monocarboxylate transporter 14-like [Lytechinus pictus]|uniref:monocarboxylate transporter 14-like n=1 Tax=Lytechinus pictus TaxID=7653 RepID=UPI0030BA0035
MALRTRSSRERIDDDDTPSDPYRHLVLLVTFLFLVLEAGITKAFGVLVTPMVFQLDSNFATVGVIFSLPWTVAHFGAVFVKPLASNIGLTKISTAGGLIAGVAITTSSFARTISALGILFFLFGIGQCMVLVPAIICLHGHYKGDFAFASSFVFMGSLTGILILPILTNVLLEAYGPHQALLGLGGLCLNMLPFGLVLKLPEKRQKRPPAPACEHLLEVMGTDSLSDKEFASGENVNKTSQCHDLSENTEYSSNLKHKSTDPNADIDRYLVGIRRRFLGLLSDLKTFLQEARFFVAFILPCDTLAVFTVISWTIFIVPFAISVGIPESKAVFVGTMGGVGGLVARILSTVILYFHPTWVSGQYIVFCSLTSLMFFIQPLRTTYSYFLVCSFFLGFGLYGSSCLIEALIANVVKPDVFPAAMSISYLCKGVSAVLTAYITGLLYDLTQSIEIQFYILGVLQAICVGIFISLLVIKKRSGSTRSREF